MNSDCDEMRRLANSEYLNLSLIGNLIVALIAVPSLLWATHKLWLMKYSKLFHMNMKIIIQMHLVGFLMHCTGRIILHSLDLFNYHMRDPCDMVPNIYRCFILRLLYNCGFMLTNATCIVLVIERYIATRRRFRYEYSSYQVGIWLAILQISIIATPMAVLYSTSQYFDGSTTMYYCVTAEASTPRSAQISGIISICVQITSRILFTILDKENKRLRRCESESTLSHKFQLEQNMSSIYLLKVFSNLSAIYLILQNAGHIIFLSLAARLQPEVFYATSEISISYPTYAIVTIIIMTATINHNRRRICRGLTLHVTTHHEHYFEEFKKQIA